MGEADFRLEWAREGDGKGGYKQQLPSKILFRGDVYAKLLKLERSIYRCDYIFITVDQRCGTTWSPIFPGRLSLNDGHWDLDRCEVTLELDDIKPEECIEANKSKELDLLQLVTTPRRTVKLTSTNITLEKVDYTINGVMVADTHDACKPIPYWGGPGNAAMGGWYAYHFHQEKFNPPLAGPFTFICSSLTKWARETTLVNCGDPSPGPEWVIVADACPSGQRKWARPARVFNCVENNSSGNPTVNERICQIVGDTNGITQIDNGMPLGDVLTLFVNTFCSGYTVVSDFFQINPDVPSAINYVTGQPSKVNNLTLFQKSDVKRPNATNATKAKQTWEKMVVALVKMFNVEWRIVGTVVRFEHVSYFTKNLGLDLTQPRYAAFMVGKRKYSYENNTIPAREEFKFMEAEPGGDFAGVPIIYSGGCVSKGSRQQVETHAVENITTDLEFVMSNPESDSPLVEDDGFVMIAARWNGTEFETITEASIIGRASLNNPLAWAQLHRDYHRYNRALSSGNMNNAPTTFFSVKPTKKGEKITVPFCCTDTFNPDDKVKTGLGVGIVDKAGFSFKDQTLELEILYNADENLTNNRAPVANNDVVTTEMDTPIDINVIANDTDPDTGDSVLAVEIMFPPTHGAVIVNPDLTVKYTPTTGWLGADLFVYRIKDSWGEYSGNALVSVTTVPANGGLNLVDDHYTVPMNVMTVIPPSQGWRLNDSIPAGTSLGYSSFTDQGGDLIIYNNGQVVYTPPPGYEGPDVGHYVGYFGIYSDTADIYFDVRDPNRPTAGPETYTTVRNRVINQPAFGGVMMHDSAGTGGPISVVPGIFATTQGGSVELFTDGAFVYTPPFNFEGTDHFDYTITNGTLTDSATETVHVLPLVYIRLEKTAFTYGRVDRVCGYPPAIEDAGPFESGTFTLHFFSNPAGTIPMDVTGLNLSVYVQANGITYSGTPYTTPLTVDNPVGTSHQVLLDYVYFVEERDCSGIVINYKNESITVEPGLYDVI